MSAAKKTTKKAAEKTSKAPPAIAKKPAIKTAQKVAVEKSAKKAGVLEADWWELRLYVAGQTPRSVEAFANLERICEEHLQGRYRIEVIDLLVNPTLARGDQILAVPTLVRQLPPPMKKIIGDFSNTERVLVGLNLLPIKPPSQVQASKRPART